jgi:hypothetical protein
MAATPLVETRNRFNQAVSRARWITVSVEMDTSTCVGRVYVPETKKRLSDMLGDDRPFLFLVGALTAGATEPEPFLAINKRFIRSIRLVDVPEVPVGAP